MQTTAFVQGERLLDKSEVADMLHVSPRTIDVWLASHKLPYIKLGPSRNALVRFRRADVEAFVTGQLVEAAR